MILHSTPARFLPYQPVDNGISKTERTISPAQQLFSFSFYVVPVHLYWDIICPAVKKRRLTRIFKRYSYPVVALTYLAALGLLVWRLAS